MYSNIEPLISDKFAVGIKRLCIKWSLQILEFSAWHAWSFLGDGLMQTKDDAGPVLNSLLFHYELQIRV